MTSLEEIEATRRLVADHGFSKEVAEAFFALLDAWTHGLNGFNRLREANPDVYPHVVENPNRTFVVSEPLSQLPDALARHDEGRQFSLLAEVNGWLAAAFDQAYRRAEDLALTDVLTAEEREILSSARLGLPARLVALAQAWINSQGESIRHDVERLTAEIREAREHLDAETAAFQLARGAAAEAKLADHFNGFAEAQSKTSGTFRGIAFAAFALAACTGIALFVETQYFGAQDGWNVIAAHALLAVGLGSIGTYAARVDSHHQDNADWANSVKVQLETFQGFLAPVDPGATRDRIYEDFARRVLGAPPALGTQPSPMPASQIVALVADDLSRQRPS